MILATSDVLTIGILSNYSSQDSLDSIMLHSEYTTMFFSAACESVEIARSPTHSIIATSNNNNLGQISRFHNSILLTMQSR